MEEGHALLAAAAPPRPEPSLPTGLGLGLAALARLPGDAALARACVACFAAHALEGALHLGSAEALEVLTAVDLAVGRHPGDAPLAARRADLYRNLARAQGAAGAGGGRAPPRGGSPGEAPALSSRPSSRPAPPAFGLPEAEAPARLEPQLLLRETRAELAAAAEEAFEAEYGPAR